MKKHAFKLFLVVAIFIISMVAAVSAQEGVTEGFPIDTAVIGTLFLLGLYGAFEFAKQTWGPDPKTWSYTKYFQIFAAAVLVSVIMYLSTGVLGAATIEQITSALALLGGSVATILGYKTVKNVATNGTIVNPEAIKPAATAAVEQAQEVATVAKVAGVVDWLSFSMTPTFPKGISPFTQAFKFYATRPQPDHPGVVSVDVDWGDGTPLQNVPMKDGYAEVSHTFEYSQGYSAYFAKVFRPVFMVIGSDDSRKSYNLTTDGFTYMCGIEVMSVVTGTKPMPQ